MREAINELTSHDSQEARKKSQEQQHAHFSCHHSILIESPLGRPYIKANNSIFSHNDPSWHLIKGAGIAVSIQIIYALLADTSLIFIFRRLVELAIWNRVCN